MIRAALRLGVMALLAIGLPAALFPGGTIMKRLAARPRALVLAGPAASGAGLVEG
jgi:hypothetical protein